MAIYYPPPQLLQPTAKLVQGTAAATGDNPPFSLPNPIWNILLAWRPGPPKPQTTVYLPAAITAVPENNPPFGLKTPLWPIIQAWQPGPPSPMARYSIIQGGAAVAAVIRKRLLTLMKVGS